MCMNVCMNFHTCYSEGNQKVVMYFIGSFFFTAVLLLQIVGNSLVHLSLHISVYLRDRFLEVGFVGQRVGCVILLIK